jgi:hypothetical protein
VEERKATEEEAGAEALPIIRKANASGGRVGTAWARVPHLTKAQGQKPENISITAPADHNVKTNATPLRIEGRSSPTAAPDAGRYCSEHRSISTRIYQRPLYN